MARKSTTLVRVREQLSSLAGLPKMVCLTRNYPSDPRHCGFVLGVSKKLVLFQKFHDFYPEGYTVLRLEDIADVSVGRRERFFERMFKGEGLLDRVGIAYPVPIDDICSLLCYLSARELHIILQCERKGLAESDFYIGRLVSVSDKEVTLLYFDSLGKWDKEPSVIECELITNIEFDTPYINTLSKYVKSPGQRRKGR